MSESHSNECPFCEIDESCFVQANDVAFAVMDASPVTTGHTLVIPRRHVVSVYVLSAEDQSKIWELTASVRDALARSGADGFNIGLNDGLAAGQTIDHAHIHVIPRRKGDCVDPRGGIRWIFPDRAPYWE